MARKLVELNLSDHDIDGFWRRALPSDDPAECWGWVGAFHHENRYAVMPACGNTRQAHRISYLIANGALPDGMVLDHLCRNRGCVNPRHLEPVTDAENLARSPLTAPGANMRKTHCPRGHAYDRVDPATGHRKCRTCRRETDRARYARTRSAA